jgi:hypothetical protein
VKCITWLEDDTGFVTTGKDNLLSLWRLYPGTGDGVNKEEKNPIWSYVHKKVVYNAVCVYRPDGGLPLVYAAGSDKSIREIEQASNAGAKSSDMSNLSDRGKENVRYDESIMYSQLIAS